MDCKTKTIGILTSGGDCPGLNAAIRGVTKAALGQGDQSDWSAGWLPRAG